MSDERVDVGAGDASRDADDGPDDAGRGAPDETGGATRNAVDETSEGALDAADTEVRAPYVESPIIMATVRVVAPFVFTYGLFVMFHGADSSGGGFQGGVVVGTVVFMLAIAFGIETTRDWIGPRLPVALAAIGVLTFLLTGIGSVLLGGAFLEYSAYGIDHASAYGIELVEVAIGVIVAAIVVGLFFAIAAGMQTAGGESA